MLHQVPPQNEQLPSGNDTGDVKHRYKTQNPSQSRSKRTAVIMGDSLVNNINGWELKEKCGNQGMNILSRISMVQQPETCIVMPSLQL